MAERFTDYEMKVRSKSRSDAWKIHMNLAATKARNEAQGIRSPRPVLPGDTLAYALEAQEMIIDWRKTQLQYKRAQEEAKSRRETLSDRAERAYASQMSGLFASLGGSFITAHFGLKGKHATGLANAFGKSFNSALMSRFPEELSSLGEQKFQDWLTLNAANINGSASSANQSIPGWRALIGSGTPLETATMADTGSASALLNSILGDSGGLIRGMNGGQQEALISRVESHLGIPPTSLRSWLHKGVIDPDNAPLWSQAATISSGFNDLGKDVGAASELRAATREIQADEALKQANVLMSKSQSASGSRGMAAMESFFKDLVEPMAKRMKDLNVPLSDQLSATMAMKTGKPGEDEKVDMTFLDWMVKGAQVPQRPKTIGEVDLEYVQGPRANEKAEIMYERDIPMDDIFKSFGRAKEGATKKNLKKWTEKMQRIPGSTAVDLQGLEGLDPTQQKLLYKKIKAELKKGEREKESADLSSATTQIVSDDSETNVIQEVDTEIEEQVDPALAILAKKIAKTALDKQKAIQ